MAGHGGGFGWLYGGGGVGGPPRGGGDACGGNISLGKAGFEPGYFSLGSKLVSNPITCIADGNLGSFVFIYERAVQSCIIEVTHRPICGHATLTSPGTVPWGGPGFCAGVPPNRPTMSVRHFWKAVVKSQSRNLCQTTRSGCRDWRMAPSRPAKTSRPHTRRRNQRSPYQTPGTLGCTGKPVGMGIERQKYIR